MPQLKKMVIEKKWKYLLRLIKLAKKLLNIMLREVSVVRK
jgi:hypothetical protein